MHRVEVALSMATRFIWVKQYCIDHLGPLALLVERASRGVQVRLIVDSKQLFSQTSCAKLLAEL